MVPSAYLRVFQPLDGFEREEQLHWERWLVTDRKRQGTPRFADRNTETGVGILAPAAARPPTSACSTVARSSRPIACACGCSVGSPILPTS